VIEKLATGEQQLIVASLIEIILKNDFIGAKYFEVVTSG
jgi:hypothetical protein